MIPRSESVARKRGSTPPRPAPAGAEAKGRGEGRPASPALASAGRCRKAGVARAAAMLVALAPFAAPAHVYSLLRPRMTLAAGYDDNIAFDGRGGDGLGEAIPGLKLDLFGDHGMRLALDCQASIARVAHPDRFAIGDSGFANGGRCTGDFRDRLGETWRTRWSSRFTYARDPFAVSSLGLLLRAGQSQVIQARVGALFEQDLTARARLQYGLYTDALNFGSDDPGNGYQIAPSFGYAYRTSARGTVDAGLREQIFLGAGASPRPGLPRGSPSGLLAEGTSAQVGYAYRLTHLATAIAHGGAILVTRPEQAAVLVPVGRFELYSDGQHQGVRFIVAHDLVLGPSHAGALIGDVAELGLFGTLARFEGRLRTGLYRNADVGSSALGSVGYGGEAALAYRFAKEWTAGIAALRDARLNHQDAGRVDRDVVELRLTWEKARF